MQLGAWGARAGALLEATAARAGVALHREGELVMCARPDFDDGVWCCWLFGAPRDRGLLAARYGLGEANAAKLPAAFGAALRERGERACELLEGRFVVVSLDRERKRCLVSRDQLGAQPLVYTPVGDGVLFAEHERELLDLLPHTPSPDRLSLLEWIEHGLTPQPRTLYEGIRRLASAHRLVLRHARWSTERWWQPCFEGTEAGSSQALAERLRTAAFAAVGRATMGFDRPALKLSGGLDSACVAAGLAANGLTDGRAFALGGTFADDPVADERALIEATAAHTHLPLERIAFDPSASILTPAAEHIAHWRLPPATPNLYLWRPLTMRARELDADILLDGEGGDELFGLAPSLIADELRRGALRTAWSLTRELPGIGAQAGPRTRLRVLRRFGLDPLVPDGLRRIHERLQARRTAPDALLAQADAQQLRELHGAREQPRYAGPLWWRSLAESLIDERDALDVGAHFRREARDAGIERGQPFLYDLELIETVLRIPPRAQFDPVRDRPVLRDALRGLIPDSVRTRHVKSHFTPLLLRAIKSEEASLLDPLRDTNAPVRAYVLPTALEQRIGVRASERPLLQAGSLWRLALANHWLASLAGDHSAQTRP